MRNEFVVRLLLLCKSTIRSIRDKAVILTVFPDELLFYRLPQ